MTRTVFSGIRSDLEDSGDKTCSRDVLRRREPRNECGASRLTQAKPSLRHRETAYFYGVLLV